MNNTGITSIYISLIKKIIYILIILSVIAVSALLIVFPVWFFAVKHPLFYSLAIIILAITGFMATVSFKLYKKDLTFKQILFVFIKIIYVLLMLCCSAAVVVLYMNSLFFQGSVILALLFFVSGIIIRFNIKNRI